MRSYTMRKLITTTAVLISILTSAQSLPPALDTLGLSVNLTQEFTTPLGNVYDMIFTSQVGEDNCTAICKVINNTSDYGLQFMSRTEDKRTFWYSYKDLGYEGMVEVRDDYLYGYLIIVTSSKLKNK